MTIEQAMNLALKYQQSGRTLDAEKICLAVIAQIPDEAATHSDLSKYLCDLGRYELAIAQAQRAVQLKPDFANGYYNLGVALNAAGRQDDAIAVFSQTVRLNPNFAEALNNLGVALTARGRFEEAIAALSRAVVIKPDYAKAHNNLGTALREYGRLHEAIAAYRRAVDLDPGFTQAMGNLGVALNEIGEIDAAIAAYNRALQIEPNAFEIHNNLAVALIDQGRVDDAIAGYRRAIQIKPDYVDAHCNLAHALLLRGDFQQGWDQQQWRWKSTTPAFAQPRWAGDDLRGKTILLHADQAFGDAIQFARYAPHVADRGAKVVVAVPTELVRLFGQQAVDINQTLPQFDLHCPFFDLPRLFGTELNSIPAEIPYLHAETPLIEAWKKKLGSAPKAHRIGLVWAGAARRIFSHNRNRSIDLAQFAPLARLTNVEFHSLQKGEAFRLTPSEGLQLIDNTADLTDFAQTAALVANLDLVISIDTSVAHLAGAMGKPVWLLLPFAADWRWMLDRDDSPWYPTMRIFRQKAIGDWAGVIETVARELAVRFA